MRKSALMVISILTLFAMVLQGCASAPAAPVTEAVQPTAEAAAPAATEAPAAVQATEAPTAAPATHEPVTLHYQDYSQERLDFYNQAAVEFNKEYPWITDRSRDPDRRRLQTGTASGLPEQQRS